jgi:hypothetical protein
MSAPTGANTPHHNVTSFSAPNKCISKYVFILILSPHFNEIYPCISETYMNMGILDVLIFRDYLQKPILFIILL